MPTAKSTTAGRSTAKQLSYEVFGPSGTVADISYFDVNADLQYVDGARLPWSLKIHDDLGRASWATSLAQGDKATVSAAASWWTAWSKRRGSRTE